MITTSKRKICVVTGTRAEYGLLRHLMKLIQESNEFDLQLIVTGSHLSIIHGETYKEIIADGFSIDYKIDLELGLDTPTGLSSSAAKGLKGFGHAFDTLKPNLLVVLGDRYEILSSVIAAMFARIPIAHLHGGESTEGLVDEAIRHSITKFSHLHFVATESYGSKVIQLGENPKTVFNVGGMGVDSISKINLLNKSDLEKSLGIRFKEKNLLITYHPVTLEKDTSSKQILELLSALDSLEDHCLIFTMPNADADSQIISEMIKEFVEKKEDAYFFPSLGQRRYLSCVANVDLVIGNSSSGIAEVPTFKKATIDIGDRQKGRIRAQSIINCNPNARSICDAITQAYSNEFQKVLKGVINPYGDGGASEKIIEILISFKNFDSLIKKEFYKVGS